MRYEEALKQVGKLGKVVRTVNPHAQKHVGQVGEIVRLGDSCGHDWQFVLMLDGEECWFWAANVQVLN